MATRSLTCQSTPTAVGYPIVKPTRSSCADAAVLQPITITKRGRVVARLVPAEDQDERPWLRIRGRARWTGDAIAPVVDEDEIDALR